MVVYWEEFSGVLPSPDDGLKRHGARRRNPSWTWCRAQWTQRPQVDDTKLMTGKTEIDPRVKQAFAWPLVW